MSATAACWVTVEVEEPLVVDGCPVGAPAIAFETPALDAAEQAAAAATATRRVDGLTGTGVETLSWQPPDGSAPVPAVTRRTVGLVLAHRLTDGGWDGRPDDEAALAVDLSAGKLATLEVAGEALYVAVQAPPGTLPQAWERTHVLSGIGEVQVAGVAPGGETENSDTEKRERRATGVPTCAEAWPSALRVTLSATGETFDVPEASALTRDGVGLGPGLYVGVDRVATPTDTCLDPAQPWIRYELAAVSLP